MKKLIVLCLLLMLAVCPALAEDIPAEDSRILAAENDRLALYLSED